MESNLTAHPARKELVGYHMRQDRLWLIHTSEFIAGITEYNDELTGFDPRLAELDDSFHYGGNAYYVLGALARQRGWEVESVEDRYRMATIIPTSRRTQRRLTDD